MSIRSREEEKERENMGKEERGRNALQKERKEREREGGREEERIGKKDRERGTHE